ncbi:MAG: hypothetical protein LBC95_02575 [Candidatus Nomurabacteria bacterium]|jgi:hypothetical protein|nr:hypothetical protein [Candidatus Nomurabacteria bacterium]
MEPGTQPNNAAPNFSPEAPVLPTHEQVAQTLPTPEAPIQAPEQSASAEQLAVDHLGQATMPATVQPEPSSSTPPPPQPVAADDNSTPAAAADGDIIEKEWIDKVKKVISTTRDDPHAQQREASRLMADYVLKRYGRKVGEPKE